MLKIKNIFLVLSLINIIVISACKTKAQTAVSAPTVTSNEYTTNEKSLLWEISGKDLKKPFIPLRYYPYYP